MEIDMDFVESYLLNVKDPHAEYAQRKGITQQEAKQQAYRLIYSSQFLRSWKENV